MPSDPRRIGLLPLWSARPLDELYEAVELYDIPLLTVTVGPDYRNFLHGRAPEIRIRPQAEMHTRIMRAEVAAVRRHVPLQRRTVFTIQHYTLTVRVAV
jgi:hypothetical protein